MKFFDITVTRTIPAPAEKVFDVWIDPQSPGGPWFGAERVILNPVVDGLLYYSVKHEGRTWPHYGRFVQIDRPRRVEYTWMSEGTKGAESIVTVTMESRGNETEVTLHHTGVPDDEMGRKHKEGWTWVLSALAEVFVSRKSSLHGSRLRHQIRPARNAFVVGAVSGVPIQSLRHRCFVEGVVDRAHQV